MRHLVLSACVWVAVWAAPVWGAGHFEGWVCGGSDTNGGVLLHTTNGTDWVRQGIGQLPLVDISGVCSSGTGNVWVVGDVQGAYAAVYYSPDSGASWSRQGDAASLPPRTLRKVCVVKTNIVWAVGDTGTVIRTVDAGVTWTNVPVAGYFNALQGVAAVDAQTAWVGGSSNSLGQCGLFKTTDGGLNWTLLTNGGTTNTDHILGLDAVDAEHVWAIGGQETFLYSTNGGAYWETSHHETMKDGNEIYTFGTNQVFAACDATVFWSDDNGSTWTNRDLWEYTMDISAPDGTNIWAVRNNYDGGEIYHSPDGGLTWTSQYDNANCDGLFTLSMEWRENTPSVLYVDAASTNPVSPYSSWATAAVTIQDAVDAAAAGDTVRVTNGVYHSGGAVPPELQLTNRVCVLKPVDIQSVNGPEATVIAGQGPSGFGAIRCAYLMNGATLSGFTLTNGHAMTVGMAFGNRFGGGVYLAGGGTVSNCVITGNDAGGAYCQDGGQITDSLIQYNSSSSGGGVNCSGGGEVHRCIIRGNAAPGNGGGADLDEGGLLRNCLIADNTSLNRFTGFGGGVSVSGGEIVNCTIVGNQGTSGGGVIITTGGTIRNSIITGNMAGEEDNIRYMGGTVSYSCTMPDPGGTGNLTNAPMLAGILNPHLLPASPCRGAGTTNGVLAGETDIDGEPRTAGGAMDIGCDQFVATNLAGALTVEILAEGTRTLVDHPLDFDAEIQGKVVGFEWQVSTNGGIWTVADEARVSRSWAVPGSYPVVLTASNQDQTASATVTVSVLAGFTNYVSTTGGHVPPFTNWTDAATNLQAAVDACYAGGGVVMVQTGTYEAARAVVVTQFITVRAAGSRTETLVMGTGADRVFVIDDDGAVVTGLGISGGFGNEGGGVQLLAGTVRDCWIHGNEATSSGGGVELYGTSRVQDCLIEDNTAGQWGGGALANDQSRIERCRIIGNQALDFGGGVQMDDTSEIFNSYVADNQSWGGGGAELRGTARNCTFVRNLAFGDGGGLYLSVSSARAINCIVCGNEAGLGENYFIPENAAGASITWCCTTPDPGTIGNIAGPPRLLGVRDPHLAADSPCINAGNTNEVDAGETDIDDEERMDDGQVDIGCDEVVATNLTGTLTVAILGSTHVVAGAADPLLADIAGKSIGSVWQVATNGGTLWAANAMEVDPAWDVPGSYPVLLTASNLDQTVAASVTVHVVAGFTNYVALDGGHVSPFTNWTDAATNIQAAVDACYVGGVVMVQTGTFRNGSVIRILRGVTVSGVGDRADTVIDGEDVYPGFYLDEADARLESLTVTRGRSLTYGGVYLLAGTVSNCLITGNTGSNTCGGVQCLGNSVLRDSEISGNNTWNWPGGVRVTHNALVLDCHIAGNTAINRAGGVYCDQGGIVRGCRIEANNAMQGGGVHCRGGGWIEDTIIHSNSAAVGAGVYFHEGGVATNSTIDWNWASLDGGGVWFDHGGTVRDCLINRNFADPGGGTGAGLLFFSGGEADDCLLTSNLCSRAGGAYLQRGGVLKRSVIQDNRSYSAGGGAFILEGGELENCLIVDNVADEAGAGVTVETDGDVVNCTVSGNTASNAAGGIYFYNGGTARNTIVTSNNAPANENVVIDGGGTLEYSCTVPAVSGDGNLAADPLFSNPGTGDFRLMPASPCIDAGTNLVFITGDLEGTPRPLDGDDDGNAVTDMGCFELLNRAADSDGDVMTDGFEDDYNLDPTDPADALGNLDGDPADNRAEYIAETDPTNALSFFQVGFVSNSPPLRVEFLSSSNREYLLRGCSNLVGGTWIPVDGPRRGAGGPDWMQASNTFRNGAYRLEVGLP